MGKMMQFDAELSARLEHILAGLGIPAEKKKMFGHETFFLNGYMYAGANEFGIMVHLGRDSVPAVLENEKTRRLLNPEMAWL